MTESELCPIIPAGRIAIIESDHGSEYRVEYCLQKKGGLQVLHCSCPGAEKGYFCRHLKDFISGELRFFTHMSEREKERIREGCTYSSPSPNPMQLMELRELTLTTRTIERELSSMQDAFDACVEESLQWSMAESRLRQRAGDDARWRMIARALDRVLDKLDLESCEHDSDILMRYHELDQQRLANNRRLRELFSTLWLYY